MRKLQTHNIQKTVKEYNPIKEDQKNGEFSSTKEYNIEILEQQSPQLRLPPALEKINSKMEHKGDHEEQESMRTHSKIHSREQLVLQNEEYKIDFETERLNQI